MNLDAYSELRQDVESQSVRSIKRFLDYGKRVRQDTGLDEMMQWIGRVLHDTDQMYSQQERAQAFIVGACEWLARRWQLDPGQTAAMITVIGDVDRVRLLRLLVTENDPERRQGLQQSFRDTDAKLAGWIEERALHEDPQDEVDLVHEAPFLRFVESLEEVDPLVADGGDDLAKELEEAEQQKIRLGRELEAASERAERAVQRLESLEEEAKGLRKNLRDERENGDKLRQERTKRIKFERDAREAGTQLQRLKEEYVKLDQRLRESVRRQGSKNPPLLDQLRQMSPEDLLGVTQRSDDDIGQARRRFASVFHSDRAAQLPPWVADLFDHLLGLVNAACDKARK